MHNVVCIDRSTTSIEDPLCLDRLSFEFECSLVVWRPDRDHCEHKLCSTTARPQFLSAHVQSSIVFSPRVAELMHLRVACMQQQSGGLASRPRSL